MKKVKTPLRKKKIKEAVRILEKELEKSKHITYYHRACSLNIELEKAEISYYNGNLNDDEYSQALEAISLKTETLLQELEKIRTKRKSVGGIIRTVILLFGIVGGGVILAENNSDQIKYTNLLDYIYVNSNSNWSKKLDVQRNVFVYLNEDFEYKQEVEDILLQQLMSLEKCNVKISHNGRDGTPIGEDKEEFIRRKLSTADLFIPLISIETVNKESCLEKEIAFANYNQVKVIPVQVGFCDLEGCELLSKIDFFPNKGEPIFSSKFDAHEQSFKVTQKIKNRILIWYD